MNEKKIRQLNILVLIAIAVSIIFIMIFSLVLAPEDGKRLKVDGLREYNERWVLKNYREEADKIITLPENIKADSEDMIVIMNHVPEDVNSDTVLMFETEFQNVMVMVGDTKVYSNGVLNDQKLMKNAVPCYNIVPIGIAAPGDIVAIYMASGYNKYSGKLSSIYYGSKSDVFAMLIKKHGAGFMLAVLLIIITVILVVSLVNMKHVNVDKRRAAYAFGFVFVAALWSLLKSPIMQIFTANNFGVYMTGMVLLLLMPVVYLMYQRCFAMKPRFAKIFEIGIYVFSINMLTGVVFQMLSVCDFATYMIFTKIIITLGLMLLSVIMYIAAQSFEDRTITSNLWANLVLTGACILEAFLSLFSFYEPCDGLILQLGLYAFIIIFLIAAQKRVIAEMSEQRDRAIGKIEQEKNSMLKKLNTNLVYSALNQVIANTKHSDMQDSRLVYDTSIYLKYNLNSLIDNAMVPFSEELEYIKAYLGIQKQMNPDMDISIEDKIIDFKVPFNTIEPLVENAVVNGALKAYGNGRIVIRSYERLDCFAIQIVDNGKGIGPDKRFSGKQGFKTIKKRLKASCGAAIEINNKPDKGTIVTVKLPKEGYIIKE